MNIDVLSRNLTDRMFSELHVSQKRYSMKLQALLNGTQRRMNRNTSTKLIKKISETLRPTLLAHDDTSILYHEVGSLDAEPVIHVKTIVYDEKSRSLTGYILLSVTVHAIRRFFERSRNYDIRAIHELMRMCHRSKVMTYSVTMINGDHSVPIIIGNNAFVCKDRYDQGGHTVLEVITYLTNEMLNDGARAAIQVFNALGGYSMDPEVYVVWHQKYVTTGTFDNTVDRRANVLSHTVLCKI